MAIFARLRLPTYSRAAKIRIATLLVLTSVVAVAASATEPTWFRPAGCEFQAAFPGKPEIVSQVIPGVGTASTATFGVRGDIHTTVVMVAEVAQFDPNALRGVDRESYLIDACQQYAEFNGLEHAEYEIENIDGAHAVTFRGGKEAGGVRMLYLCRAVLGHHSMITVRGGGPAASFPQSGLLEFIGSIRRQ